MLEDRRGKLLGWTRVPRQRPCVDVIDWRGNYFRFRDIKPGKPVGYLLYREASVHEVDVIYGERPTEAA